MHVKQESEKIRENVVKMKHFHKKFIFLLELRIDKWSQFFYNKTDYVIILAVGFFM